MPTEISGSTGVNKITDGTIVNADIGSSAAIATTKLGTGAVVQVVQTGSFARTETTSSSWVATNNTLAITPSATSSKVLIQVTNHCRIADSGSYMRFGVRLKRGSTVIWNSDGTGESFQVRNANNEHDTVAHISYLDSPSTTSATTYTFEVIKHVDCDTLYAFESIMGANMILMEIAG
tara:strand:+ start:959 stop:1492 length:534 start_codon:yes stop_codon:yes gene_type:complete